MARCSLYDRADLYDLMAPRDSACEAFCLSILSDRRGPVLELACGTGRLTIPLAKTARQVVGGDLSDEMLQAARLKAQTCDVDAKFVKLDMRNFDLEEKEFDTIFIMHNSLTHLVTIEEFRSFFASAANHLPRNGKLVFDVFVPSVALLSSASTEPCRVAEVVHAELGPVLVDETATYDPITQMRSIDWHWSSTTRRAFAVTSFDMRQLFPQELRALVNMSGFRFEAQFGDFDRSSLGTHSPRQVSVCVQR